jgi:molybdopterin converting factor small subunit
VRKISEELLNRYRDRFGTDIEQNKKVVTELAKVTSKQRKLRTRSPEIARKCCTRELVRFSSMITIKLLGPIRRAYHLDTISLDKSDLSISNIISLLREEASNPDLVEEKNIVIAINGIQSSLLPKFERVIKNGDVVTVASLVHGG